MAGDFGDDDPTVVDGRVLSDHDTPVTIPRCAECGAVVFFDDFDAFSLASFPQDRCLRARDGHWTWCANFSATHGKVVFLIARR
jgi:hypothetical protein